MREISQVQSTARDRVLFIPMHWRMGYHKAFTIGVRAPEAFGHYGYGGYGYYGSPYHYGGATRTTVSQYTEANVYIDMVDSSEHKLVWQGVATFTLTDKMQKQLRETVMTTVDKVFTEFPVPAPATTK